MSGGDLLVRGGSVVLGDRVVEADVLVRDGIVAGLGRGLDTTGVAVEDAGGLLVLPGLIDPHVHFGWPGAADDFASGSRAAVCGGVTTVLEFAVQFPGAPLEQSVAQWQELGRSSHADFGLHAIVSDATAETLAAIGDLADSGVTSFKMFMTSQHSGGLGVDDGTLFAIMRAVAAAGGLAMAHCENDQLITHLAADLVATGVVDAAGHSAARPPLVEADAVARAARLAEAAGAPFYVPHLSSAAALEAASSTTRRSPVVVETCPQFLALDDEVYHRPDGANFVMSPPIKSRADQEALWRGVVDGVVRTVGSDHCPYPATSKAEYAHEDFRRIPNGVPGVQTLLPVVWTGGVRAGRLSVPELVRLCSTNPAEIFGLGDRKGRVALGFDGDLVLVDPEAQVDVSAAGLSSDIDYSIYADQTLYGRAVTTVRGGTVVARDGRLADDTPGRFLARARPDDLAAYRCNGERP